MGYVLVGSEVGTTPGYSMVHTVVERDDIRPVLFFCGVGDAESMTLRFDMV